MNDRRTYDEVVDSLLNNSIDIKQTGNDLQRLIEINKEEDDKILNEVFR